MDISQVVLEAVLKAAAGSVAGGLIERLLKPRDETVSPDAAQAIKHLYPVLEGELTGGSVRTLVILSSQYNLAVEHVFDEQYPHLKGDSSYNSLVHEFEYRLRYLVLLGVVTPVGSEYAITNLGLEFLRAAQDKLKYEREIPRRLRI